MNSQQNHAFLQIDVNDWCTAERVARFKKEYFSLLEIFALISQSHELFARSWIQIEQVKALKEISRETYTLEKHEIADLIQKWSANRNEKIICILSEEKIFEYSTSEALMMKWASNEWGHRLESLYLERKDSLDHRLAA